MRSQSQKASKSRLELGPVGSMPAHSCLSPIKWFLQCVVPNADIEGQKRLPLSTRASNGGLEPKGGVCPLSNINHHEFRNFDSVDLE